MCAIKTILKRYQNEKKKFCKNFNTHIWALYTEFLYNSLTDYKPRYLFFSQVFQLGGKRLCFGVVDQGLPLVDAPGQQLSIQVFVQVLKLFVFLESNISHNVKKVYNLFSYLSNDGVNVKKRKSKESLQSV